MNVLDWTAGPFLVLYMVLYAVALFASGRIARALRPDGIPGALGDAQEVAVMGPGRERLGEVIASRMLERGMLRVEQRKLVPVSGARPETHVEAAIMALPAPIAWARLRKVTDGVVGEIEQRLTRRGLMQENGAAMSQALLACAPLFALLLLGLAKAMVGASRGHPVGFLVFFMIVTAGTILFRWLGASRATRAGEEALAQARLKGSRLKLAPAGGEAGMAVALFGTGVLATSMMGDFHRMRANSGSDSGGGSSDSGCSGDSGSDGGGSSGCGGGGCGGCGG